MKGYFRKRGDKWSFTVDLGKDPETKKRKQKTVSGFKTKKEAEKACNELINQLNKGTYLEPTDKTVEECLYDWLELIAKQSLRPSTFQSQKELTEGRIIPGIGKYKMSQITPAIVQKFYKDLIEKEKLSAGYVRTMHIILKKAFSQAVKWQLITQNIINLVEPPRMSRAKDIETWSLEEATRFLEYTEGKHLHIAYVLAIYTGMRRGEILGLRWKDCDLEQGKISIRQTLNLVGSELIFQSPKTKGSKRLITITENVIAALKKHKAEQNQNKLRFGPGYSENDLVVCNKEGNPIYPRNLVRNFHNMMKQAGVPHLRFHDLRHTHATILLSLGENPKVVSERLGHSKVGITLDTYSHVLPDMQQRAAENFEEAMKQKKAHL